MIVAKTNKVVIMRHQINWEGIDMWNRLKIIVVWLIVCLMFVIFYSIIANTQLSLEVLSISILVLAILGATLTLLGVFSNIKRRSKIKVGAINRAEFYGVLVTLISALFYLNTRIDQIMMLLAQR